MSEQFEKVPTSLATDATISLQARAVYPILLAEAWRLGARAGEEVELPSIRELSVLCGCSTTALKGYLRELSDSGWVLTVRAARGRPQRYVIRSSRGSESAPRRRIRGSENGPRVGRKTAHSRARDPYSDEVQQTGELKAPPAAVLIEGRNLPFDALASACSVDPRNRARSREVSAALRDIRLYVWDDLSGEVRAEMHARPERFEHRLAATIRDRAGKYRTAPMTRGMRLTPTALAKWWHDAGRGGGVEPTGRFAAIDDFG